MSLPKTHPQVLSSPLSDLERRIKLISSKLDEGNVKRGIKLAASDDKNALFSTDNHQNCCLSNLSESNLQLQIQKN